MRTDIRKFTTLGISNYGNGAKNNALIIAKCMLQWYLFSVEVGVKFYPFIIIKHYQKLLKRRMVKICALWIVMNITNKLNSPLFNNVHNATQFISLLMLHRGDTKDVDREISEADCLSILEKASNETMTTVLDQLTKHLQTVHALWTRDNPIVCSSQLIV